KMDGLGVEELRLDFSWAELQMLFAVPEDEAVIQTLYAMSTEDAGEVGGIIDGEAAQHAELAVDHLPPFLDAPPDLVFVPQAAKHCRKVAPLNGTGVEHVDEFIKKQETRHRL